MDTETGLENKKGLLIKLFTTISKKPHTNTKVT